MEHYIHGNKAYNTCMSVSQACLKVVLHILLCSSLVHRLLGWLSFLFGAVLHGNNISSQQYLVTTHFRVVGNNLSKIEISIFEGHFPSI